MPKEEWGHPTRKRIAPGSHGARMNADELPDEMKVHLAVVGGVGAASTTSLLMQVF